MVIFDCDGVLVDSEPISNSVLAGMLGREGLAMSVAQARSRYQGLMLEQVRSSAESELGRPLGDGWIERYEHERTEAFRAGLRAVTGARDCVQRVAGAGLKVCVASQGKLAKTRLSLELTGLSDLFEPSWLFSADSVARGKPHPDLFLHAASSMGVPAGSCVVVEDTPSGAGAAVAAGMPVFGYAADSDEAALERAGARIIRVLSDLPAAPELS
jgi:HAD superfamily hydrolase (TIGR01509 family)